MEIFLSARLRKLDLILEGNVPERLFCDPKLRREGKTRRSNVGGSCEKEIEEPNFSLHTKLALIRMANTIPRRYKKGSAEDVKVLVC